VLIVLVSGFSFLCIMCNYTYTVMNEYVRSCCILHVNVYVYCLEVIPNLRCYSVTLTFDRVATQSFVGVRSCYYNLLIVNLNIFLYTYKICQLWPLTIRMSQLGGMALGRDG